jgi:hypothetical protein
MFYHYFQSFSSSSLLRLPQAAIYCRTFGVFANTTVLFHHMPFSNRKRMSISATVPKGLAWWRQFLLGQKYD